MWSHDEQKEINDGYAVMERITCKHYTLPFGNKVCYIKLKGVTGEKRPDWCPLRELPEKKETNYYMNNKGKGIVEGWNACLDAIENK